MLPNVVKIIEQANTLNELKGSISVFVEEVGSALDNKLRGKTNRQDTHYDVWDRKTETLQLDICNIEQMYFKDNYLIITLSCEYFSDDLDYTEVKIKKSWVDLTYPEIAEDIILESKKKFKEELREELEANKIARVYLLKQYEELMLEELRGEELSNE